MSEWTGALYGFYSDKSILAVFNTLKVLALQTGYQFDYQEYEFEHSLFFYKNEGMLKYHQDRGYNTDLNGEGCFCIEAKLAKLNGKAALFEFDDDTSFEPYDIHLMFDRVFYYRLITPNEIIRCDFSAQVYQLLKQAISNTTE